MFRIKKAMLSLLMFSAICMIIVPFSALAQSNWKDTGRTITIYYQSNYERTFIYFSLNGTSWTAKPGIEMNAAENELPYQKITVRIGKQKGIYFAFTDGAGAWELNYANDGSKRFFFVPASMGTVTVENGVIMKGKPTTEVIPDLSESEELANEPVTTPQLIKVSTNNRTNQMSTKPEASPSRTATPTKPQTFRWENATVYFVLTDRFLNGEPENDYSYGREVNLNGENILDAKKRTGTFHGGDLKGLTSKVNEGYFNQLGVNAIWISSPLEQIHGWVASDRFRSYGYHGYWPLDYTEIDRNMGTKEDFQQFVDAAHANGIRVIMDVVLNHPGYNTLQDMYEFQFGEIEGEWQEYYYNSLPKDAIWEQIKPFIGVNDAEKWANWWGDDWIRADLPGYRTGKGDELTMNLAFLPDFKTESEKEVTVPPFLIKKWGEDAKQKLSDLDLYFQKTGKKRTVRNHLIKWLTDYVREFGIDGFRCDTAKHVDLQTWKELKQESVLALREWKQKNPSKKLDDLDFWMTAEVFDHGVYRSTYFDHGFDSVINFSFQEVPTNMDQIETVYRNYAEKLNAKKPFQVLSYVSSHDKSLFKPRNRMSQAGSALMLAPGAVQIFYGDEMARPLVDAPGDEAARGDMNWDDYDPELLRHWQILGQFRQNHPAVGAGAHAMINAKPYTFSRQLNERGFNDQVVIAFLPSGSEATWIQVKNTFENGQLLRDAYTGQVASVRNGEVRITPHASGVVLLEAVN